MRRSGRLLDVVVWRFARDDHVVDMAFAQTSAGDAHKLSLLLQVRDGSAAEITHAGAQSADELIDHGLERPAIGHATLDAFGDELGKAVLAVAFALHDAFSRGGIARQVIAALEVTFSGALIHSSKRAHAAIAFEAASLVEDGFARALIDAGEERADHDGAGAGCDGLGDFARVLDAAVSDDGD